jgi:hypothetical protein
MPYKEALAALLAAFALHAFAVLGHGRSPWLESVTDGGEHARMLLGRQKLFSMPDFIRPDDRSVVFRVHLRPGLSVSSARGRRVTLRQTHGLSFKTGPNSKNWKTRLLYFMCQPGLSC